MNPSNDQKKLAHHVFFWLKNPGSAADRDQLIQGIKALAAIEVVQEIHVSVPASVEPRPVIDSSWDVSELMFFKDVEDQNTYQVHPLHQEFIRNYGHLWAKVLVYDAIAV